jgi:hypothetical protein
MRELNRNDRKKFDWTDRKKFDKGDHGSSEKFGFIECDRLFAIGCEKAVSATNCVYVKSVRRTVHHTFGLTLNV